MSNINNMHCSDLSDSDHIATVAPFSGLSKTYDYAIPRGCHTAVGSRVWVELGHRQLAGIILSIRSKEDPQNRGRSGTPTKSYALKAILHSFDEAPIVTDDVRRVLEWASEYYFASLSDLYRAALPGDLQLKNRIRLYCEEGRRLSSDARLLAIQQDLLRRKKPVLLSTLTKYFEKKDIYRAISTSVIGISAQTTGSMNSQIAPIQHKHMDLDATDPSEKSPITVEPVRHELNPAQQSAVSRLISASQQSRYSGFLLHGVTGSGKTEVYLDLIESAVANGKTALVLVPEISLTPQLAGRFKSRFGGQVTILHSALRPKERLENWHAIQRSEVSVVVGPRSIIFSPLKNIGAIVVDEEHDSSYKQSDGIRYNGRDLALMRASINNAVCVLGSATPSFETEHLVSEGRLTRLELPKRATQNPLPDVSIIDLKTHLPNKSSLLSQPLLSSLSENLAKNQQSILLLNRRGFSNFCLCKECGHSPGCENCSVTMTYHIGRRELVCHYCDERKALSDGHSDADNPDCSGEISLLGFGTQRLEESLVTHFPGANIRRIDRDAVSKQGFLEQCLEDMRMGRIDILVGTQMLAKGHDFPNVTLVGVVLADLGLKFPDFRAAERTFQLVTQVSGRAGRGDLPGKVIVQSYQPTHPAIQHAAVGDYGGFSAQELFLRRECLYPPYGRLALVQIDGEKEVHVAKASTKLSKIARRDSSSDLSVLGPSPAPLQRLRGRIRYQVLFKAKERSAIHAVLEQIHAARLQTTFFPGVRIHIDRDPYNLL